MSMSAMSGMPSIAPLQDTSLVRMPNEFFGDPRSFYKNAMNRYSSAQGRAEDREKAHYALSHLAEAGQHQTALQGFAYDRMVGVDQRIFAMQQQLAHMQSTLDRFVAAHP